MVLIVRGELRLTAGKAAVQTAHAAVLLSLRAQSRARAELEAWLAEGGMKVALVLDTLEEMEDVERRASRAGIPTVWVDDAGYTEVAPGTRTCLGLGPCAARLVDPITGEIPLL